MYERAWMKEIEQMSPFDRLTKSAAVAVTAIAIAMDFILNFFVDPGRARVGSIFGAMSATVIWMRWDIRRRVWFWFAIAAITAFHTFLIIHFSWTNRNYPGVVLLPGALVDLAFSYGVIKIVEKILDR
jgi:hypothetical protein